MNIKIALPALNEDDMFCPTCGQPLPDEKITEARNLMYENLERKRLDTKQELTDKVAAVSEKINKAKELIKTAQGEKENYETILKEENEKLNALSATEYPKIPTFEELLAQNPNYKPVLDEITSLEHQLESETPVIDQNLIDEKTAELLALKEDLSRASGKTAAINEYKRVQNLISAANQDHKALAEQLASLQREEDIAREFADKADNILEEKVNKHFEIVRWKMFKQMINGNKESYCECYVDGIAYHDGLNTAKKLNAGLDICNTLCKIYDFCAPIIIDNAESNLNILNTESQQIRFYVADTELIIK